MLHPSERRAISYFAAKAYQFCRMEGFFVDAGSFVGGSLVAAIEGVERIAASLNGVGKRFIAYDLFKANEYMIQNYPDHFSGRKPGEEFLDIFYKVIGDYRGLVEVHKGDIIDAPRLDSDIAFLFVDILWSWKTNAFAIEELYPRLIAGKSLLLHQDFVYPYYPWLPISMEYYSDYFEFFDYAEQTTAIYRVKKSFPKTNGLLVFDLDIDLQLALLDAAADRVRPVGNVGRRFGALRAGRRAMAEIDAARPALVVHRRDRGVRRPPVPAELVHGLADLRRVFFASPGYFAKYGRPKRPEDLSKHQCIVRTARVGADIWPFTVDGKVKTIKVTGRFRANGASVINEAATHGLGIAIAPLWHIRPLIDRGLVELALARFSPPPIPVHATWSGTRVLPAKTRLFVDFLVERFGETPQWDDFPAAH
jgi:hypothetical protein